MTGLGRGRCRLVLTGASGTVGRALAERLAWPGPVLALGRTLPPAAREGRAGFRPLNLADPAALQALNLAGDPAPVGALVCVAGVDSRARLQDVTPDAATICAQVNALAPLQLLHAVAGARTTTAPLRAVLISSDIVGSPTPGSLLYAAAKAAAEEGFQHATADLDDLCVLIVRLPAIGVPMASTAPGPAPPPRSVGQRSSHALADAITAINRFLTQPPHRKVTIWNA